VPASAAHWLLVCLLCTLVYWAIGRLFFRCGRGSRTRFVLALLCVSVAGAMVNAQCRTFVLQRPLLSFPLQVLFLMFFYLFADRRFTSLWTRWLMIVYVFSQFGTLLPAKQASEQSAAFLLSVPGLLGALTLLGDMLTVTVIVVGLIGGCGAGTILVLIVAALVAPAMQAHASTTCLVAHTTFYLFATLVPVAAVLS
jgi:hypothetical protein